MRLLIIRHAQSVNNAQAEGDGAKVPRVEDPEITELGAAQADHLGRYLASLPEPGTKCPEPLSWRPSVLYTSLMLRAAQTSSIVQKHTGVEVVGWEDIHETGGIYLDDPVTGERRGLPGASRDALARRFPRLRVPDSVSSQGWWNSRPHETEPQRMERSERVAQSLFRLSAVPENATRTLGLMTHGAFYSFLIAGLLRIPGSTKLRNAMYNTGCTLLELEPEETKLVFHNCTAHLPPEAIT